MGLISTVTAYKVGKRQGRHRAERRTARQKSEHPGPIGREDCANYHRFCKNYGSCDGQVCETG